MWQFWQFVLNLHIPMFSGQFVQHCRLCSLHRLRLSDTRLLDDSAWQLLGQRYHRRGTRTRQLVFGHRLLLFIKDSFLSLFEKEVISCFMFSYSKLETFHFISCICISCGSFAVNNSPKDKSYLLSGLVMMLDATFLIVKYGRRAK